ncbi:MAG: AmmeMemoRadiSam system protein B, partial [Micromonosporaceae bacterium]
SGGGRMKDQAAGGGPTVRPAAVAGRFYPDDVTTLTEMVDGMLDTVTVPDDDSLAAAYVVPHAGYRFSGPIAAHVYARLRAHAGQVRRVVLVGPSHFVRLQDGAVPTVDNWTTPLGDTPVDTALRETLLPGPYLVPDDGPHQREHSLEVQLPFLRRALGEVPILPIAIGVSTVENVVDIVDRTMNATTGGTVLICSTDLSHYQDQATAQHQDRRTAEAVLDLDPDRIGVHDACGVFALRGTVGWARQRGLTPELLDLRTSADTYGTPDRVVGYPAFAFH